MTRRWLFVLFAVAIVIAIGWVGVALAHAQADRSGDASIPSAEASAAEQDAHLFWDNPIQRMLYVAVTTVNARRESTCPTFEVTAFTFFGFEVDHVFVDCEGINRSP